MAEDTIVSPNSVNMTGMNTHYANQNKWIGYVPMANLSKDFKNLELNLTRFTIPQMNIGTTETAYKGYTITLPTKLINAESKEITWEYIIKEDWSDYRALYAWGASVGLFVPTTTEALEAQAVGESSQSTTGIFSDYLDCRVWLLDNFKKRTIEFVFRDCFIKHFGDMALDVSQPGEIKHSVTMAYSRFEIAPAQL